MPFQPKIPAQSSVQKNHRFKLGHVNIARKGPVNCRILKTSVKIPGPVNQKIWKTSSKIPDPQSQVVHVNKLKLIHAEPGFEEPAVPDEVNPPIDSTEVEEVRPRRNIRKPSRIANDYVFNLLTEQQKLTVLSCHLCGHPPFSNRRLWKGHLFVVHRVKSTHLPRGESANASGVNPVRMKEHSVADGLSPAKELPMYEDV